VILLFHQALYFLFACVHSFLQLIVLLEQILHAIMVVFVLLLKAAETSRALYREFRAMLSLVCLIYFLLHVLSTVLTHNVSLITSLIMSLKFLPLNEFAAVIALYFHKVTDLLMS
jgi:DMSO/TMAO reductase YedYZ heme-binding membrane subunit